MSSTTNWKHILLLFVPGTLWGSSFLLNEISLQTIPPATLTGVRNLLAIPLLLVMLRWTGGQLARSGPRWRQYAFIGFFNNAFPFFLISWGQQFIESGLAAILLATMPLCTILLAHFLTTDEKLTAKKVTGIGLGLAGVLVLIGPGALRGLGLGVQGQLAVLGASLSYAVGGIYARNVFRQRRSSGGSQWAGLIDVTTGQFITSVIFMLPWMVAWEQVWTVQPSGPSWWALVAQSWLVSIAAVLVYYYLIDVAGASIASTVVYLIPINGVFWGVLILNEVLTWQAIAALALILLGIAVINNVFGARRAVAV